MKPATTLKAAAAALCATFAIAAQADDIATLAAKIEAHEAQTWRALSAGTAKTDADFERRIKLLDSLALHAAMNRSTPATPAQIEAQEQYARSVQGAEDREALANWPQYSGAFDTVFHDTTVRN
jgi:hypothetical protein